jgi:hypothetical protein
VRRGVASQVFLVGYLLVQVALPLRQLFRSPLDSAGDFSWNMYADYVHCGMAYVRIAGEEPELVDPRRFLNRPSRIARVLRRDRLPRFHAWLCGQIGDFVVDLTCAEGDGPEWSLTDPTLDACKDPRGAVRAEPVLAP